MESKFDLGLLNAYETNEGNYLSCVMDGEFYFIM